MSIKTWVSQDDLSKIDQAKNPPKYEPGFEGSDSDDFDALFGAEDDFGGDGGFGEDSSGDQSLSKMFFGESGGQSQNQNQDNGGFGTGNDLFGQGQNTFNQGQGNGLFGQSNANGQFGMNQQQPWGMNQNMAGTAANQPAKPDLLDNAAGAVGAAAEPTWHILMDLAKSLKTRTADDIAYYSTTLIKCGAIVAGGSLAIALLGTLLRIGTLGFLGVPIHFFIAGLTTFAMGLIGMGACGMVLVSREPEDISKLPDASQAVGEPSHLDEAIESSGSIFDDLFSDEDFEDALDSIDMDLDTDETGSDTEEDEMFIPEEEELPAINLNEALDDVRENQLITREALVNTFVPMFPINTPKFAEVRALESGSSEFIAIEGSVLKAMSNVAKVDVESLNSKVISIEDTFYSYIIRATRIKGLTKLADIEREVEVYLRESSDDLSVNASVAMEGDYYKIVVTKGQTAVVTFGDCFKQSYVKDFYLNQKNMLPIIQGIDELGNVLVADAKLFDTMMIVGKPRSGKSWYVLSILTSLMLFNSPEDVQFILVDPKETNLFRTLSLMPHVCGLHNDRRILDILNDIIEVEAPRRRKLLKNEKCDDIWAVRKKGIRLPVLYLVLDEYITIIRNLGDDVKEFNAKIQVLISQLPSLGIRLIFVPHRSTSVVDRTNRTMIQFTAAVRSDPDDVVDALGIKKWDRPLVNTGDIAVKSSSMPNALYARGAALTTSDETNTDFIEIAAKAFYKMGVEVPEMSNMRIATNRDSDRIRRELVGDNMEQFNASNILNDLNSLD